MGKVAQDLTDVGARLWFYLFQLPRDIHQHAHAALGHDVFLQFPVEDANTCRITLIDGEGLLDLWVKYYDKVDEDGRQMLPIKPVHFLDLEASTT